MNNQAVLCLMSTVIIQNNKTSDTYKCIIMYAHN